MSVTITRDNAKSVIAAIQDMAKSTSSLAFRPVKTVATTGQSATLRWVRSTRTDLASATFLHDHSSSRVLRQLPTNV